MQAPAPAPLPHSGWGIASLVISLLSWLTVLILASMLANMQPKTNPTGFGPTGFSFSGLIDDVLFGPIKEGLAEMLKAALMFPGLVLLFALGFGIAGWVQRDRDSTFAILGSLVSAIGVVSVLMLILM